MKKKYMKPTMMMDTLQQESIICASDVTSVSSNADLDYDGGGSGTARARSFDGWGDDDEE